MYITTLQEKGHLLFKIFLLNILVTSCVTVTTPDGGPPDMTLPEITSSNPKHEQTNFKGRKIIINFNKEIGVEDIYNQLIVMPMLQKPENNKQAYQYNVRGRSLIIKPACPLKEDTTYTFAFNEVIKDLKEGNKAKNSIILTFSTGNSLDLISVEGYVRDLLKKQPLGKVNVCLYNTKSSTDQKDDVGSTGKNYIKKDAVQRKENIQKDEMTPDYFTQTDQDGKFKFPHIKAGTYNIRAHNGEDNKFKIDYQKDSYGFLPVHLNITETMQDIEIPMVQWDVSDFKLVSQKKNDQFFEITCNKAIASYSLIAKHTGQKSKDPPLVYSHLVGENKIIRVYNTFGLLEEDSCEAVLKAVDAIGNTIEESINIQFREGEYKKEKIAFTIKPSSEAYITPKFTATIHFTKPIKKLCLEGIYFVYNKDIIRLDPEDIKLNAEKDKLTIFKKIPWKPRSLDKTTITQENTEKKEQDIALHIMADSLIAADNSKNAAESFVFFFKDPKKYGSICGKITTNAAGFIIQLLDTTYEVIDSIKNEKNYQFKLIKPGDYMLRILVLNNKEATWSAGNIRKNIPPDPVIFYPDTIAVIENWEIRDINFEF